MIFLQTAVRVVGLTLETIRPAGEVPLHPSGQHRASLSHLLLHGGRSQRQAERWETCSLQRHEPTLARLKSPTFCLHVLEELLLENFGSYRFLVAGHVEIAGQEDDVLFDETLEAMEIMGFSEEERIGI